MMRRNLFSLTSTEYFDEEPSHKAATRLLALSKEYDKEACCDNET
jgi:hypothetical protein